ncbi:MAG TPA: hypothetical protein VJT54_16095, partial [Verrucomicrobiae bacterium]|nr:hypothetical protein [Verrucomicrobiae bacterium]
IRELKRAEVRSRRAERRWFPRLAWGLVTAACILMAFAVGHWRGQVETKTVASSDILQNAKLIRETLAMFPNRVRAIVCDKNGFNLVLSDHNDVPDSTPIYIRVCDGEQCAAFVTFSGQEIAMAGQEVTVLSDGRGGIILEGKQFVWSSDERMAMDKGLKIEAKALSQL